jgi:hypothetical protein
MTLRNGLRTGFFLTLAAVAALVVVLLPLLGSAVPPVGIAALLWLPVLGLAEVLRRTVSLPLTLLVAALGGVVAVLLVYLALGDPVAWWQARIEETGLGEVLRRGTDTPDETLHMLASNLTGLLAMGMVLNWLVSLLIGRWWQSLLYNPGGLRDEFLALRLGRTAALAAVVLLAVGLIGRSVLAANLLVPISTVFALQGIAAIHGVMHRAGVGRGLLIAFYVLVLLFSAQTMQLLAIVGIVDNWLDLRRRVKGGAR